MAERKVQYASREHLENLRHRVSYGMAFGVDHKVSLDAAELEALLDRIDSLKHELELERDRYDSYA